MEKLTKGKIKEYLKTEGMARNMIFQAEKEYVLKKEGEKGLEKLKKRAQELGADIPYGTISATGWHPMGLFIASIFIMAETFGWEADEMKKIGHFAAKVSFIAKIFVKHFISLERFTEKIPQYWGMYFTSGNLEVKRLDEKKREIIIRIGEIKFPYLVMASLEGYFEQTLKFILGKEGIKESSMIERGDCYEYTAKWQRETARTKTTGSDNHNN